MVSAQVVVRVAVGEQFESVSVRTSKSRVNSSVKPYESNKTVQKQSKCLSSTVFCLVCVVVELELLREAKFTESTRVRGRQQREQVSSVSKSAQD